MQAQFIFIISIPAGEAQLLDSSSEAECTATFTHSSHNLIILQEREGGSGKKKRDDKWRFKRSKYVEKS